MNECKILFTSELSGGKPPQSTKLSLKATFPHLHLHQINKGPGELLGLSARLTALETQISPKPFSGLSAMKMFEIPCFGQSSHFTSAVNTENGTGSFLPPFFHL